jgi:hypothetical protein
MVARPRAKALAEELADDAEHWRAAYERWLRAARARDRRVKEAERRLVAATGGLGLARWEAACRRQRIVTVDDARLRARAVRATRAVEAALSARERVVAEQEAAVLVARSELAKASSQMARYGAVGAMALGVTAGELRRLARPPSSPGNKGRFAGEVTPRRFADSPDRGDATG